MIILLYLSIFVSKIDKWMKLHTTFVISLFFSLLLFSCHKRGFEKSLLYQADSLMQELPDSAFALLKSITHPEKLSREDRAKYALLLTRVRNKMHMYESNDSLISIAIDYYQYKRDKVRKMQAYYYRGCVYRDMRRMDLAVQDFLYALKIIPQESRYLYLGAIYENLARCYEEQNLYNDAMDNYRKAREIYIEQKKEEGLFYALRGIGYVFMLQNQLDSSLIYYQRALELADRTGYVFGKSAILSELGILYNEKGEYLKANQYLSESIASVSVQESTFLFSQYLRKGSILRNLQQVDSARYYLNLSKLSPYIYNRAGSYSELYKLEKQAMNYPAAIAAVDSFIYYLDSIYDTTKVAETTRLADKYELELYQQKLSDRYKIEILCLLMLLVIGGAVYLVIDKRRNQKYLSLQDKLMKSRADVLVGECIGKTTELSDFEKILKSKMKLCLHLFVSTTSYIKLRSIEKEMGVAIVSLSEGQEICTDIYKNFGDVMLDLKIHYTDLTREDVFYCVCYLLGCSKQTILSCTRISEGAFKSRKSRIKEKVGKDFFEWMTELNLLNS